MTQIQHEQLKPCPFCGGAASGDGYVYYSRPCNDTAWDDGSPITEAFFCNCPSCGVSNMATGIGYRSKAEAIAAWNTRAAAAPGETLAQVRALLESLRDSRKSTPREVQFARNALIDLAVTEGRA